MSMNDGGEPAELLTVVRAGRWRERVVGVLALAGAGIFIAIAARADIEYSLVPEYLFNRQVLEGLRNTLLLSAACMGIGVTLGVLAAVMGQSRSFVARTISGAYIWAFRGTPVLVQLLLWFNLSLVVPTIGLPGLGSTPTNDLITPFLAALLALGINEGSYMTEIIRAGIISVDKGQSEAGLAIGLSRGRVMTRIVLPQALRVIVPPTGNEFITMLKYTSLAYTVAYSELLGAAYNIYTSNLKVVELLITVSIWYLFITTILTIGQRQLEKRLSIDTVVKPRSRRAGARTKGVTNG